MPQTLLEILETVKDRFVNGCFDLAFGEEANDAFDDTGCRRWIFYWNSSVVLLPLRGDERATRYPAPVYTDQ